MNRKRNFNRRRTANGNYHRDRDSNRWVNDTEKSLEEEEETTLENQRREQAQGSVMETYKRGLKYPKEIQEVHDFWGTLYYKFDEHGDNSLQKDIINELSDDGIIDDASRNGSFSFGNLTKEYQVLVFESYYRYKSGKNIEPIYESDLMIQQMAEANLIKTPKQKIEEKAIDSKVTCWNCDDPNQKIVSVEDNFPCSNCKEMLWVGEGGFVLKGGIYK